MFMGEFRHNIDTKGRLIIPSKIRNQCGASVVITRGFDGCLVLYTQEGWAEYYSKLHALPKNNKDARKFVRMQTSSSADLDFDKLGRINIPNNLREIGNLDKECIVIGVGDHVEIWNQESWDRYYDDNKDNFDELSESLDGFDL